MEPPPAPIAETLTTGIISGKSPTSVLAVNSGTPAWQSEMSVLVPPMSKVMSCSRPAAEPTRVDATTPDAGPESTVSMGRSRAVPTLNDPPLLAVM